MSLFTAYLQLFRRSLVFLSSSSSKRAVDIVGAHHDGLNSISSTKEGGKRTPMKCFSARTPLVREEHCSSVPGVAESVVARLRSSVAGSFDRYCRSPEDVRFLCRKLEVVFSSPLNERNVRATLQPSTRFPAVQPCPLKTF